MFLKEMAETAQSVALACKLYPTETSIYERVCREYSKLFYTELTKVYELNPEFVFTQVYANNFDSWDEEERLPDIYDLIGSLSNPDWDADKERTIREENEKIVEQEKQRIRKGKAVHESLEKDKMKFVKEEEKPIEKTPPKELPKSGGINFELIKHLQNEERESGDF